MLRVTQPGLQLSGLLGSLSSWYGTDFIVGGLCTLGTDELETRLAWVLKHNHMLSYEKGVEELGVKGILRGLRRKSRGLEVKKRRKQHYSISKL